MMAQVLKRDCNTFPATKTRLWSCCTKSLQGQPLKIIGLRVQWCRCVSEGFNGAARRAVKKKKKEREKKDFGRHYILHLHLKGLNRRPSGGYATTPRLACPTYMHNFQEECVDLEVFFHPLEILHLQGWTNDQSWLDTVFRPTQMVIRSTSHGQA